MQRLARPEMERASAETMASLGRYDTAPIHAFVRRSARWTGNQCEAPAAADNTCRFPLQLQAGQCIGGPTLSSARLLIANALVLAEHGDRITSDYRTLLKDRYAAEIFSAASLDEINDWVRQKTEGKIDKLLETLGRDPVLVLLNAVYFKAAWSAPFAKRETRHDVFHLSSTAANHDADHASRGPLRGTAATRLSGHHVALRHPALAMIVVLPMQSTTSQDHPQSERRCVGHARYNVSAQPVSRVTLALPRFKAGLKTDLVPPFRAAGLKLALSDNADFSGMTGGPPGRGRVKIGQIRHRAVIEVLEEGTEAAAATAVVGVKAIAMSRPEPPAAPFIVDRPFQFYIVDTVTRAMLLQGRIADPSRLS